MQLRWSALIALWTMLSGPVFSEHTSFLALSRVPASPSVTSMPLPSRARQTKPLVAEKPTAPPRTRTPR